MANTKRRVIDRSGNMFIPMNMEGNNYSDSFWQTYKLITIVVQLFILAFILLSPVLGDGTWGGALKLLALWLIAMFFVVRFVIFEEKFNYKMYKQMLEYEVSTPATFWDIVAIKNTEDGAILTYRDGKIAVMLKVDRDTITGKPREFKETHFDAIQDFYHRLQDYKLSFVQMNIMEPAGNDPRLAELDKLVVKNDNPNIRKLMQLEVGFTKTITKRTLYESDLFLIYVKDRTRIDTLMNDVEDCVYELMNGAYIGYRFMDEADILDFIKDEYGVSYFNRTQATLSLFSRTNQSLKPTFRIAKVEDTDGREFEISDSSFKIIHGMADAAEKGKLDKTQINLKRDVISKDIRYQKLTTYDNLFGGIDLDDSDIQGREQKKPEATQKVDVEESRYKTRKDMPERTKPQVKQSYLGRKINKMDSKLEQQQEQFNKRDINNKNNNQSFDNDLIDFDDGVDVPQSDETTGNGDWSSFNDDELNF